VHVDRTYVELDFYLFLVSKILEADFCNNTFDLLGHIPLALCAVDAQANIM